MDIQAYSEPHLQSQPPCKLFKVLFYPQLSILYFDQNWDVQECAIEKLVNEEQILTSFQARDLKIILNIYELCKR